MKNKGNNWILYALGIAIIGFAIYGIGFKMGKWGKPKGTKVTVTSVSKKNIIETVRANGKIYPVIEVKISPDISGEIVKLLVKEGDSVKAGQLLAVLNADLYISATERANASVSSAGAMLQNVKAQLAQFEAQFDNANENLNRQKQLYNEGIISKAELQVAELQVKNAKATLNAARESINSSAYNVKSAQATAKEARDNMRRTNIYAPMSGIVSLLNIKQGEKVVGNIQMTGTEMMRIASFENMEAQIDVSENDIVHVNSGDTAIIEVDAYPNIKFKGIVTQIANSAKGLGSVTTTSLSTNDQVTNFVVKVMILHNSYQNLLKSNKIPFRPGMSCNVDIQTETHSNVLTVPVQSVTTRAFSDIQKYKPKIESDEPEEVVFVIKDNFAYAKPIKIGIQDDKNIEIQSGLIEGEKVIDGPYNAISKLLKDSTAIQIVSKEQLFEKGK